MSKSLSKKGWVSSFVATIMKLSIQTWLYVRLSEGEFVYPIIRNWLLQLQIAIISYNTQTLTPLVSCLTRNRTCVSESSLTGWYVVLKFFTSSTKDYQEFRFFIYRLIEWMCILYRDKLNGNLLDILIAIILSFGEFKI